MAATIARAVDGTPIDSGEIPVTVSGCGREAGALAVSLASSLVGEAGAARGEEAVRRRARRWREPDASPASDDYVVYTT